MKTRTLLPLLIIAGSLLLCSWRAKNNEDVVKVMTYNILQTKFNDSIGDPHNWNEGRRERVVAVIARYSPDILCLQEDDYNQGVDICATLGLVRAGVSKTGTPDGAKEFNGLYYDPEKFTVTDTGHFFFSDTPDVPSFSWDATYVSHCNWFKIRDLKRGNDFCLFNLHLSYPGAEARVKSGEMLRELIPAIADSLPVIVTGDMNDRADSPVIDMFRGYLKYTYDAAPYREGPYGTFNALRPDYDFNKYKLDYMFVSDSVEVLSHHVIACTVDGYIPSDHFPVQCELIIK